MTLGAAASIEYFTFEIDGIKAGFYEQSHEQGLIYSNARFVVDGSRVENPFWVEHEDGQVTRYKRGGEAWRIFDQPADVFPSSALPLILDGMGEADIFNFRLFDEGQGKISGEFSWVRNGDTIEERFESALGRYFRLSGGRIVEIGWGGRAISARVEDRAEAIRGTVFALEE